MGHPFVASANADSNSNKRLDLPRILCLHGGGVNSSIFQAQARALIRALPDFRLVFADAAYYSCPGPGMVPVYEHWGPFRRWLRWKDEDPPVQDEEACRAILKSLEACKQADAGTGPWAGVLGFSQGAKIASSLLYHQQQQQMNNTINRPGAAETAAAAAENRASSDIYQFGIIMAGRGPLVSLSAHGSSPPPPGMATAGQLSSTAGTFLPTTAALPEVMVQVPTIHVHGLKDPGLYWHKDFLKRYHDPRTVTVIEWDGAHRIPLGRETVGRIAENIYLVARQQGVNV